jgi:hypothetical protein
VNEGSRSENKRSKKRCRKLRTAAIPGQRGSIQMEMYAGVRNVSVRVMGEMEDEKREGEAREIAGENKICRRVRKSC